MNIQAVLNELKKVINGKDDVLIKILMCIISDGHIIMEDLPGTGKTTIAKAFAKVMGLEAKRLQFTSDVMPSDITGYITYDKATDKEKLVAGPIFNTNMLLADEINRASSKSQAALLEAMEERQATINGRTLKVEDPFVVIGTMNPYVSPLYGISVLPQSQLDRFMMALSVGYADRESEKAMMKNRDRKDPLEIVTPQTNKQEILELRNRIKDVTVDDAIYDYIIDLAHGTRENSNIQVGISPRTELILARLGKTHAYFNNRNYVVPEDIEDIFIDTCIHRITLPKQDLNIISKQRKDILNEVLHNTKKPNLLKKDY